MDLQSFLQSGLLESYALGQCSPAEKTEVEAMLAQHEAARTELRNVEMALEQYAQTQAVAPPAWMKGRISELLQQEQHPPNASSGQKMPKSGLNGWAVLLGVASILLGTLWINSLSKENALKNELNKAQIQIQDCETEKNKAQSLQEPIALLQDPATQHADLAWLEPGENAAARASVYFNPNTRKAFVGQASLPALSGNQDYQLWVIVEGNPNPIPLNLLDGAQTLAPVKPFVGQAQAFAVSIEPKGGSPNGKPTKVVMLKKIG
jgi:anti-sigma-K factor RskA